MTLLDLIIDFLLNPWFILSLIFWVIVIIFVFLLRNKKEAYTLFFPLLVMFKTKKLNNLIRRISKKSPRFWRVFWNIGIFVSFGFTIYGFYFFFTNIVNLLFQPSIENAIVPLIPGVTIDIPIFMYLLLPLLFIMTTHEFAHGISANIDGVEIKSTGVLGAGLFFLVGFGAFVEVDERTLRSSKFKRNTRFRIAAAGTYVNAITAGVAFLLILSFPTLVSPFYVQTTQVYSVLTPQDGGFNYGNLESGDAIVAIKRQNDPDSQFLNLDLSQDISLTSILSNSTRVKFAIGENLTFSIYNPSSDSYSEKNVTVGPRYNTTILYKYIPNGTGIIITYNFSSSTKTNILISKVNGTAIDTSSGKTLELLLTDFNLKSINLTTDTGINYILDVEILRGGFIGVQSNSYWMHKNDFAKFFTSNWPDFLIKELVWLFIIAFSITLFNMMPLPIFDGDRFLKELIDWIFGEDYKSKKKKTDRLVYKGTDTECKLTEYRVENVEYVKILLKEDNMSNQNSEVLLGKENYELVDSIGDGYKDTVSVKLSDPTKLKKNSVFEVSFEYLYDEKRKIKRIVLNTIRLLALGLILGNFVLSFSIFGFDLFGF
ncbi:MAG: site-2 protease family protein [Candidatus Lokiarchaeota archaeon]|nr:site-2 protease family protein [Candidatus Lokiarchaeota archaeon]